MGRLEAFLKEPLQGKTSLGRVVWVYGVLGSLVYGALEVFIDPANAVLMRLYVIGGLVISVYTAVATYRCAANCRSAAWARLARVGAVLTLVLLPIVAYLELSGALDLALMSVGEQ